MYRMQAALIPAPLAVTRTGSRAARVGAFALEVWSRVLVDGASMSPDERARELSWVAENLCALHGVRLSVRGVAPKEPCLLVANHVSYFDPVTIAGLVPCTAVAKSEVGSWPLIGEVCRRLGILYVARDDAASGASVLRRAMRSFERGVSVLVFPEGTTTTGARVLPFKRGAFGAASLAGVPIQPIAIRYESADAAWVGDETFVSHYLRTIVKPYTRVHVDLLEPLPSAEGASAQELAEQAHTAIADALLASELLGAQDVPRFGDAWSVATA